MPRGRPPEDILSTPTLGPQGLAGGPHFCTRSGPTSASPQSQERMCIFKN